MKADSMYWVYGALRAYTMTATTGDPAAVVAPAAGAPVPAAVDRARGADPVPPAPLASFWQLVDAAFDDAWEGDH